LTTYDLLTRAEKIERVSGEIYAGLAETFAEEPSLSTTLKQLAQEEIQHAARIRLLRTQYQSTPGLCAQLERAKEELGEIEAFVFGLRDELTSGRLGRDLALVRPRLIEMEERLCLHAERMARGADAGIRRFYEALAKQDQVHRRLLESGNGTAPTRSAAQGWPALHRRP
jgi:rubrerythrin